MNNGPNDPTTSITPAAGGAQQQLPLTIRGQYIKDLSFEIPRAPESISSLTKAPDVDINIEVAVRNLQPNTYEVALAVRCEAKAEAESIFILELAYAGVFALANVPEEHVKPVLFIECPRHLFPFARNIVATLTQESSLPPMLINPIDFAALYRTRYQEKPSGPVS